MARIDLVDLALIEVDARRAQAVAGEFNRERQADIAEADDAGAGGAVLDSFKKGSAGCIHGDSSQAPVSDSMTRKTMRRTRSHQPSRRTGTGCSNRWTRTPDGVT